MTEQYKEAWLYISKLIAQGEHQQLDFKFAVSDSRKIARSLVAFANTDGGTLLIGVKDNGRIAGIRTEEEIYMVETASMLHCSPSVAYSLHLWEPVEGKQVLEVKIEPQKNQLFYARNEHENWCVYLRYNDMNIVAEPMYEKVWKRQHSETVSPVFYDNNEQILYKHLAFKKRYTFSEIQKITAIETTELEVRLTDFIMLGLMKMFYSEKELFFEITDLHEK